MLISAFLSLFAWAMDWQLGILFALVLPSLVAMDTNGNYSEVFIFVILASAIKFVKFSIQEE